MKRELRLGLVANSNNTVIDVKSSGIRLYLFLLLMVSGGMFGQITEGFESTTPPASGWTYTSVTHETANFRTGARCAGFNATNDAIVTPLVSNPNQLSFWWRRSGTSPTSPQFTVQYGSSSTGPWTNISTGSTNPITSFTTTYQEFTADLSSLSNIYIRILHTRTAGANVVYIDDFSITAAPAGFTVTFNSNGGTGTMANQTASVATNLTTNTFTRTGYTFTGWNTAADGSGTAYANGASFPFTANTTLYAQWLATYTLTYNGNGQNSGTAPTDGTSPYASGATVTVLGNTGSLTRTGYTFSGWNTAADGSGTDRAVASTFSMPASNTVLYAKWTINNYSVAYDGNTNTGGTVPATQNGNYNTGIIVANEGDLTKTGYTFNGWNTATNGSGTSYTAGATYTIPASNSTLYAQWLTNAPFIDPSGTLSALSTIYGTASSTTTFSVSGVNLTADILITPPSGFEVSTTAGSGYTTALTLTQSGGTVASTTIYVRLAATTIPSNYSGNVELTSTGAITKNVATVSSTVSTKNLTISGLTGANRVYDATATATANGTATLDGIVGSDDVNLSGTPVLNFANKTVANGKAITVSGYTLAGTTAGRYTLTQPTGLTANITHATLTIAGAGASNKTYNGTTAATITGTLSGILLTDVVTLNGTGTFDTANAGTGKAVTSTSTLGGADAGNYTLTQPTGLTADINKANQTITFGALTDRTFPGANYNLTATASSGLTVSYTSSLLSVATISGSTVTLTGVGTTIITASQSGNGNYNAATDIPQNQVVISGPCLSEDFSGGVKPTSWIDSGTGITYTSNYADMSVASGNITTIAVSNPTTLTFDLARTTNATAKNLNIEISTTSQSSGFSVLTNYDHSNTTSGGTTACTVDLSSFTSESIVYIRFNKTTGTTSPWRIDNVKVYCGTPCTSPTLQPSSLSTNTATIDGFNTSWTVGNGNGTMIVVRPTAQTNQNPSSGTAYTPNLAWASAGQINTNNRVVFRSAGSTAGPITGLTAETQYTVTGYEYNTTDECYNTTSAPTATVYTLSTEPTGHSATFTNTVVDYQQINLAFSAATGIGADGYVILRRADGVAPTTSGIVDGVAPGSWTLPSGTVLVTTTTSGNTFNNTGLSGSTAYCYLLVPYNWNGSITGTYNYRTTATVQTTCGTTPSAPSLISDIINYETGFTYTDNIDYKSFQSSTITDATNNVAVFNFKVRDGGVALSDTDLFPTILQGVVINYTGQASTINKAELFSGSTKISSGSTVAANSITFSLSNLANAAFTIADNTETTFTLRVTFNTTALDNDKLVFSVGSATAGSTSTSSQFTTISAQSDNNTGTNKNRIEVIADRLTFGQQPSSTSNGGTMTPAVTVRAIDINSNLDLDFASSVSVACSTPTALTGNPVSAIASSGVATFSSLVHTIDGTYTMTGSSTGLTSTSASSSYTIATFTFTTGDYRTNPLCTGPIYFDSTSLVSGIRPWQSWSGSAWVDVTGASGSFSPQGLSTKPENIYIISGATVDVATGGTYNNIIVENAAAYVLSGNTSTGLTIAAGKTLDIKAGYFDLSGRFALNAGSNLYVRTDAELEIGSSSFNFSRNATSNFIVENEGYVYVNNYLANIWTGNENFAGESFFTIYAWDNDEELFLNATDITTNTVGSKFGYLEIDLAVSSALAGNWTYIIPSGTFTLTNKDLRLTNNTIRNISLNPDTITIGGDFIVAPTSTGAIQGQTQLGTKTINVKGNFIKNGSGDFRATSSGSGYVTTINVDGNFNVNQGAFILDNGSTSLSTSIINLKGNLYKASGSYMTNGNTNSTTNAFNFTGSTLQTVNVVVNASNDMLRYKFFVKNGAYVMPINQDWQIATESRITVENGGTFDFGFNGSTPLNVIETTSSAITAFVAEPGSTLKITSNGGIAATGTASGNILLDTRTYAATGIFGDYHYIGNANQDTGNGLPASVRNLIINNEGLTNDVTITNASVQVNGNLLMQQGNIVSTPTNLLQIGISTGTPGTLTHINGAGVVKGSGATIGTMRRYFSGSNTGNTTGLFPLGTIANQKRFITMEFTGATGGYLDATFVEGEDMSNAGVSTLSGIPAVGGCPAFTVLSTDEILYWRVSPQVATLENGTHNVTLRKESATAACKQTVLKRNTAVADWRNPGIHQAGGTELDGDIFVKREGMSGALKDFGLGDGYCSNTPIVISTSSWPATTQLTPVEVNTTITLPTGISRVCECLVNSGVTVIVPDGATLEVVNGITLVDGANPDGSQDGKIIIENNGSLVQVTDVENATANINTGNISMYRHTKPMYRYDYTYWSSPVYEDGDGIEESGEFTLDDLSQNTLFDKYFKWNHAATPNQGWQMIPNGTEAMVPGRGYIVRAPQNYPIEGSAGNPVPLTYEDGVFIGKPNNGIVRHPVTGSSDNAISKWNLLGNPYPSAIDADLFLDLNTDTNQVLGGTLYFWTHNTAIVQTAPGGGAYSYNAGDYAAWNGSGSTATVPGDGAPEAINMAAPSGKIAAGQAFFVKGISDDANAEAIFNNNMRIAGQNNQFFKPAPTEPLNNWDMTGKHRVWLNMKGQVKGFNQTLVGYIENATNSLDNRFDGDSFGGNQVTFYSVLENKKLAIQGRALPFNNQDEVPLGYKTTLTGTLTISIDHYDGLFDGQDVYLEDKLLNIVHNIKVSPYSFTTVSGTFNERFVLRYLPAEELSNPDHEAITNGLIVYKNDNTILIKSQLEVLEQVTVYDLLGRIIFDKTRIGQPELGIQNVVVNEQPLIVKVKLANGRVVNKKIVY